MLKKFLRDTKANVTLMAGAAIVPMLIAVGVGVDMSELYRARTAFQASVDAAALGAAKTLSRTANAQLSRQHGQEIFDANMSNLPHSTGTVSINTGNGDCTSTGVTATATLRHPMFFDKVHGFFSAKGDAGFAHLASKATVMCGGDTVEIALVLDNSGSMNSNSKLGSLKSASRNMINTLHDTIGQQSRPEPVRFSLVPFAGMVNIGPNNRSRNWMDRDGRASYHHEHFDWASNSDVSLVNGVWRESNGAKVTRFSLYDNMGINWAGCVEQRPHPYHTNDASPNIAIPDTLYVPSFAPDEPDDYTNKREQVRVDVSATEIYCIQWKNGRKKHRCKVWNDPRYSRRNYGYKYWGSYHPVVGYANRYGGEYDANGVFIGGSGVSNNGPVIYEDKYMNNYLTDEHNRPSGGDNPPQYAAEHTGREADQYKRQRWTWKYFNNPVARNVNANTGGLPNIAGLSGGPNFYCTTKQLEPLTPNRTAAINSVNAMTANGATNVQQGIAWGWRTLSHKAPFDEGRDESVADNKKIMVVMTDGNNTYYPYSQFDEDNITKNPSLYGSYGFNGGEYSTPLPKRMFQGFEEIANPTDDFDTYRKAMNEHMLETCENVKAAGIQIYTIAFDVPAGADVRKTLEDCSSKGKGGKPLYYPAEDNADLINAFKDITEKISELSIKF